MPKSTFTPQSGSRMANVYGPLQRKSPNSVTGNIYPKYDNPGAAPAPAPLTGPNIPNTPSAVSLTQGTNGDLIVNWAVPASDDTHDPATTFALRYSLTNADIWAAVPNVVSPYDLTGLPAGAAIDVQLQSVNAAGVSDWSPISTLATASAGQSAPNAPSILAVAPRPDGTNTTLTVTWPPPVADGIHGAATGYNLRSSPHGAGTWTTVSNVTSPYSLTGLVGATALDVQVQATNAAPSPGAWSPTTTGTTWGVTIVPGNWVAAPSQIRDTPVGPNGGVQMTATAAPTAVSGAAFAWSAGNIEVPTTGLIAAGVDGHTTGWGLWFSARATPGTYYLWLLAQDAGGVTSGALVTSAITVT
jgi:hypothetical protein